MYRRLLLCTLLLLPVPLPLMAQQAAVDHESANDYVAGTGDAWIDRQLGDINRYADWYPDAFVDELFRYHGLPHAYADAVLKQHGWRAGDLYFAAVWGKVSGFGYRELVRARSRMPAASWSEVLAGLPQASEVTQWRAVRHALVASYDHWDRPIQLDALLRQQLGDRAQRDKAAAARHSEATP